MALSNKEYQHRYYQNKKANNLCVSCGKPLDREGCYCKSCLYEKNRERREDRRFYIKMHICPRCRKNKLYGDETRCIECTIEENKKAMKSRNKLGKDHYNKVHREWSRQSYKKCVENGICYVCRKSPADGGYKTCGVCREKQRTYKRIKYQEKIKMTRSERIERGLCYFCDNPQKKGYKVCEKHWQMNVKKSRNPKNHPWNTRNKYGFSKV